MKEKCKKQQKKNKQTERSKWNRSYSERARAKSFSCAFKLGFLQLICKASLVEFRVSLDNYFEAKTII